MREELRRAPKLALVAGIASGLMIAAFALAAYSFAAAHRGGCDSRNATASLFHDVIVIASTPDPGKKPQPLSEVQRQRRDAIFARIDQIRC